MSETHTSREHVTDAEIAELQTILARASAPVAKTAVTLLNDSGYTVEDAGDVEQDPNGVLARLAEVHPFEAAEATLAALEADAFLNALYEVFGL